MGSTGGAGGDPGAFLADAECQRESATIARTISSETIARAGAGAVEH